jgi:hypothetical protein
LIVSVFQLVQQLAYRRTYCLVTIAPPLIDTKVSAASRVFIKREAAIPRAAKIPRIDFDAHGCSFQR